MLTLRHKIALFVLAATLSAVAGALHNPPMFCDARTGQCSECVNDGVENGTNGVKTIERASTQGAPYGATSVMRTITTWTPATLPGSEAGLINSIRHENGTIDRYSYTLGSGTWTETITHNHELSPTNIQMRTTRDVRIWNARGDLLETRTDLLTSADTWTPIERTAYTYDLEGHITRTEDLSGRVTTTEWGGACCGKTSETDWDARSPPGRPTSSKISVPLKPKLATTPSVASPLAKTSTATGQPSPTPTAETPKPKQHQPEPQRYCGMNMGDLSRFSHH